MYDYVLKHEDKNSYNGHGNYNSFLKVNDSRFPKLNYFVNIYFAFLFLSGTTSFKCMIRSFAFYP